MLVVSALLLLLRAILPGLRELPHTIAGAVVRPRTLYCCGWLSAVVMAAAAAAAPPFCLRTIERTLRSPTWPLLLKCRWPRFSKVASLLLHGLRNSNDSSLNYYTLLVLADITSTASMTTLSWFQPTMYSRRELGYIF